MTAIAPTVGRMVHFMPTNERGIAYGDNLPLPAIVTKVNSDGSVNLTCFDHNGAAFARTNVVLVQQGQTPPKYSYCQWMPFQVATAAAQAPDKAAEVAALQAKIEADQAALKAVQGA